MSGRRGHQRYAVSSPASGALRVLRDIVIDRLERDEVVAISQVPAIIGEEMSLDLISSSGCIELKVKVLESRPAVVAGSLRHRLRLMVTTKDSQATHTSGESLMDSTADSRGVS